GFSVRTGVSGSGAASFDSRPSARIVTARDTYLPNDEAGLDLAGIVRRIDALETAMQQAPAARSALSVGDRTAEEERIKRVGERIARSEMKQQGELVLRIAQVVNAFDAQRKDDLGRIQANLTNLQGTVTKEAAAHVDLVNYLTTAGKQK